MADIGTTLKLGDFVFSRFEIPESIPFGGSQALVTHKFPGGARAVQAMGRDDSAIGWTGLFFGELALNRSRFLDAMRVDGKPLAFSYHDFSYTVVIESFTATLKNAFRIPYSISLLVVEDKTKPVGPLAPAGVDVAIKSDSTAAVALGAQIADPELTTKLSAMDSALKGVSDFAKATTATISAVVGPVTAVLNRVNTLMGASASVLNSVTTLGGILPGNPIAAQALNSFNQLTAATQMPLLINLRNVGNRMQGNLGAILSTQQTQTVTVASGTLFDVAAQRYGDATKWPAIAQANGLSDPLISGVQTLKIPTIAPASGGVVST